MYNKKHKYKMVLRKSIINDYYQATDSYFSKIIFNAFKDIEYKKIIIKKKKGGVIKFVCTNEQLNNIIDYIINNEYVYIALCRKLILPFVNYVCKNSIRFNG